MVWRSADHRIPSCSCTWWSMSLLCGRAGRRLPFHAAETDPHGLACSEGHRDSTVAVCCLVIDVPVVQVVLIVICTVFGVRLRSTRCGFSGR